MIKKQLETEKDLNVTQEVRGLAARPASARLLEAARQTPQEVFAAYETTPQGQPRPDIMRALFGRNELARKKADSILKRLFKAFINPFTVVLIVLAVKDRQVWVAVGYGLEGQLPDSKTGRLIDENAIPYYKNDNFADGTEQLYFALLNEVRQEYGMDTVDAPEAASASDDIDWEGTLFAIGIVIVLVIIVIIISNRPDKKGGKRSSGSGYSGGFDNYSSYDSGSSYSGSSGGGGSFGGGGAGRSF